jgi:hypothetical protein
VPDEDLRQYTILNRVPCVGDLVLQCSFQRQYDRWFLVTDPCVYNDGVWFVRLYDLTHGIKDSWTASGDSAGSLFQTYEESNINWWLVAKAEL